jgi:hypothetical protein
MTCPDAKDIGPPKADFILKLQEHSILVQWDQQKNQDAGGLWTTEEVLFYCFTHHRERTTEKSQQVRWHRHQSNSNSSHRIRIRLIIWRIVGPISIIAVVRWNGLQDTSPMRLPIY